MTGDTETEAHQITLSREEIDRAVEAFPGLNRVDAIRQAFRHGLKAREEKQAARDSGDK
jgi:metal-responsive CopG/Arc/MetJ family transcriptional regulator